MAVARLLKLELLAHAGLRGRLLSTLQEEGFVHIDAAETRNREENRAGGGEGDPEAARVKITRGLDYLSRWEEKPTLKQRLMAPRPELSREKREEALDFAYDAELDELERLRSEEVEILSRVKVLEKEIEHLEPFRELELPVRDLQETRSTDFRMGILPTVRLDELEKLPEEGTSRTFIIRRGKRDTSLLILCHIGFRDTLDAFLKESGFSPYFPTDTVMKLAGEGRRIPDVIRGLEEEIEGHGKRLSAVAEEARARISAREDLMRVHDALLCERAKRDAGRLLGETDRTFHLQGWIREADLPRLESRLAPLSDDVAVFTRPPVPEDEPPVVLDNPPVTRPFELVTRLYGLPGKGSFDPTPFLAPFFFVFLGLTVSEAGYGLLVSLLSLIYLKTVKPKGGIRSFVILLAILGGANVVLGTLVGGWFGFPVRKLMVLDPLTDPVSFLVLALVLGFIQVWFGILLNVITGLRNRDFLKAVFVQGGWLLLLPGLVLYLLTRRPAWGIAALVGAAGIVFFSSSSRNPLARFFGGLYGLYDISGYLSDVLSYSRLLALGLATSVIAMVVNTLCQTALGIPWVGWLVAALIFVGGHLFNLGISFLGGFVHSMRLQFVEFFSKFFTAGGRPFRPLDLESKYVDFI